MNSTVGGALPDRPEQAARADQRPAALLQEGHERGHERIGGGELPERRAMQREEALDLLLALARQAQVGLAQRRLGGIDNDLLAALGVLQRDDPHFWQLDLARVAQPDS